jgi:hypothetical protein
MWVLDLRARSLRQWFYHIGLQIEGWARLYAPSPHIRSGTHSVPLGGVAEGLTQWEATLAESLSAAGYATALYGKWHLGSENGRLPNDQGFDEWYGIPRIVLGAGLVLFFLASFG